MLRIAMTDHYGFKYAVGESDDGERIVLSIIYEDEVAPEHHRIFFQRHRFLKLLTDVAQNVELTADERAEVIQAISAGFTTIAAEKNDP